MGDSLAAAAVAESRPLRVLIADDDPTALATMTAWIEEAGLEPIAVTDGAAAKVCLAVDDPPEVAILDWVMPGTSGLALCRFLMDDVSAFVYTVLVTARSDKEGVVEGLRAGAHEFWIKPLDRDEFDMRLNVARRIVTYERALRAKNAEVRAYARQMRELAETRARQLLHAERLATLGMLSAGIAHEIRNPLAYVSGNLQVFARYQKDMRAALETALDSGTGDAERLRFMLDNGDTLWSGITEGIRTVTGMLENLSRFARKDVQERKPASLRACIDQAVSLSHNHWKYHAELTVDADDLPPVSINQQEIVQVLVNLIVNAADATRDNADGGVIEVALKANGAYQRIMVSDNGPGIPADIADKVWDPFFTTKPQGEGTGLGLAICSGIVESHGGLLFFKNLPDRGVCFIVDLPAAVS